jgi:hypothetical protein
MCVHLTSLDKSDFEQLLELYLVTLVHEVCQVEESRLYQFWVTTELGSFLLKYSEVLLQTYFLSTHAHTGPMHPVVTVNGSDEWLGGDQYPELLPSFL